jgi:hypothetical protein
MLQFLSKVALSFTVTAHAQQPRQKVSLSDSTPFNPVTKEKVHKLYTWVMYQEGNILSYK